MTDNGEKKGEGHIPMSFSGGLERARMVYGGVVLCVFVAIAHSALIEGPFRRDTPRESQKSKTVKNA